MTLSKKIEKFPEIVELATFCKRTSDDQILDLLQNLQSIAQNGCENDPLPELITYDDCAEFVDRYKEAINSRVERFELTDEFTLHTKVEILLFPEVAEVAKCHVVFAYIEQMARFFEDEIVSLISECE